MQPNHHYHHHHHHHHKTRHHHRNNQIHLQQFAIRRSCSLGSTMLFVSNLFIIFASLQPLIYHPINAAPSAPPTAVLNMSSMNNINNNYNNLYQHQFQLQQNQHNNHHHHQSQAVQQQQTNNNNINNNNNNNNLGNYTWAMHELLLDLRQQIVTKSIKFDEHFRTLLSNSKRSLHNMFSDTYGVMYDQNVGIFTSLFESLEQYYATGEKDVNTVMRIFFERLYLKIFQVLNQRFSFGQKYLDCATDLLARLKPFGEVPNKVIGEITHAFISARSLNQALNGGFEVIKNIMSLGQPPQCTSLINEKLLKMNSPIPSAQLIVGINQPTTGDVGGGGAILQRQPCLSFCETVISRCVGRQNLEILNKRWFDYVTALSNLTTALSTRYNIETIIAPLDVHISEAIMNFQENGEKISNQVFAVCGWPKTPDQDQYPYSSLSSSSSSHLSATAVQGGGRSLSSSHQQSQPIIPSQASRLRKRAASPIERDRSLSSSISSTSSSNNNNNRQQSSFYQNGGGISSHLPMVQPKSSLTVLNGGSLMRSSSSISAVTGIGAQKILPNDLTAATAAAAAAATTTTTHHLESPLLIDDVKKYMLSTAHFWSSFPNSVCTSNFTLGNKKQPSCFTEPLSLNEQNTDPRYRVEITKQGLYLERIKQNIELALKGKHIDWSSTLNNNNNNNNDDKQLAINLLQPSNINRPNQITITIPTTTTTTTIAPDTTEEDDPGDEWEEGSGDGGSDGGRGIDDETDPMNQTPSQEEPDDLPDGGALDDETTDPDFTTEPVTSQPDLPDQDPNSIDTPLTSQTPSQMDSGDPLLTNIISPPNQFGAQKSSETSSKLVISNESHMLFAFIISVALLIVTHFQLNRNES